MKQSSLSMFAEDILKDYGSFMEEHDSKLQTLRQQMPDNAGGSQLLTSLTPAIEINYLDDTHNDFLNWHNTRLTESELLANKPLTTLANLCNQCNDLTQTAQQLQLQFVTTSTRLETRAGNGGREQTLYQMSAAIDFFCQIYFLLKRIIVVLQNIWMQLTAYVSNTVNIHEAHLFHVFDAMAELLEQLVVFNELTEQSSLSAKWPLYKKWLQTLLGKSSSSTFEVQGVQSSLDDIDSVISGNIFQMLLVSLLDTKKQMNLKDASVNYITQHSNAYVRQLLTTAIEATQANEWRNYEEPKQLLRLTSFICVLHKLGILLDGKLIKSVLETLSRYQRVPLQRNVFWSPHTFIGRHAKTLLKTQDKAVDCLKQYNASAEKLTSNDLKTCRQLGTQIALWSINMQRCFAAGPINQLKTFAKLILLGQSYGEQVNSLIDGLIRRHLTLALPITKSALFTIYKLLQYLQMLQKIFASNQIVCMRYVSSVLQWQTQKIQHLLLLTKRNILDLKLMQRKMSILTTLKLSERSLKGYPPTRRRLTIVNLALSEFLGKERLLPTDKQKLFKSISMRANNLSRYQQNILGQFDSTQLINNYDSLSISDTALKEYVQQQQNPFLLQNIFAASNKLDKNLALFKVDREAQDESVRSQRIFDWEREFLSNHLEFLLRVEALSHLLLSQDQPFTQQTIDYRLCINVAAIENDGVYNILRDNLENYFTATFYNLTTIAPHDWKSYEKMRHLANKLLQLRPVDDYLPNQIIDQGIDVLQIMRNIHTFASSYAYNMNLQLFVEMQSRNKHLDIIGTRHVANSVQTHGTGIINTTVNFIYQFLRQKFYTFSTFLHDEHIKSRLLKEFRYHADHKHVKPYQSYPYERAESFIKKIRKLGVSQNGETYMDLFRKVITQVGNAVGYVRLLQSGSKNANYRSRSFMSRFNSNFSRCDEKNLEETTQSSIREYEKSVEHLKECYSDNTNYFKLLMQGFQPFLCNPHNHHLKTFFLITPALMMNYIDYRVKEKLKMYKKDQMRCSLFEDGFAIGLIYILNMLNQLSEFHELGWSQTTAQQLQAERLKLKDIMATSESTQKGSPHKANVDEKLLQTVAITERHVNAYEQEYNLLYATLSSAEIFFQ
ncbi:LOW QUALITY PROTEIN: WASH complex subunit 4 [Drosophila albomicans]|uniref:LOW QUALITY PROTEIN: WASH complex subunit 4 n=1 Tax=Drosophila albomicans TaxID=7291 RepID=A0A6P8ZFU6_DROAB|nr:LOW QUALITY PROTEIN: WASH complex subunit 4 [Drosophila albomicans]